MIIKFRELENIIMMLFQKVGVPAADAKLLGNMLTSAEARGVYSHGVHLANKYIKLINKELINNRPKIFTDKECDSIAVIDGDNGLGPVVAAKSMNIAINKAKISGSATVCVKNSNHYGAGFYFVDLAVKNEMMAFIHANSDPLMAPWGGKERYFGTNPYTFGAPAGKYPPYILDMATSVTSYYKLVHAKHNNEKAPEGWGIDRNGIPSSDPNEIIDYGSLLPFGGFKGCGIAGVIEILSGILSGASYRDDVQSLPYDKAPANLGFYIHVIDISKFMHYRKFIERMETWIKDIKSNQPAQGFKEVKYPGEISAKRYDNALRKGVVLTDYIYSTLKLIADDIGIDMTYIVDK